MLFRKINAAIFRIMPFRTSLSTSRKVSKVITSFPINTGKEAKQPGHPNNIQLQLHSIIFFLSKNLSIFDKIRVVTGTGMQKSNTGM